MVTSRSGSCGSTHARHSGGLIADDDVLIVDDFGQKHLFHLEAFYNRHEVLTLLTYKEALPTKIAVALFGLPNFKSTSV